MKLSEISRTLREIQVSPVKTLGQNFLHDQNLARWIVQQAELSAEDFVLEIGPGLGALTEPVLESGAEVLAIEKDGRLANFLQRAFRRTSHRDRARWTRWILKWAGSFRTVRRNC
jgi:16S rRNA (adenine1518-N6/adenine1519-N6)-dimethyltransferase